MYYDVLMQRYIDFAPGEYYHVYNRGVDKRLIYLDESDRERMIKLLYVSNSTKPFVFRNIQQKPLHDIDREPLVAIGAYCLMPNHFHILVKELADGGVTSFMEKLSTAYSMYFNVRNQRKGFLFESNFKATHVNDDEYLKYLYAYIHLNPVKLIDKDWKEHGIQDMKATRRYLDSYRHSSYLDYTGVEREEGAILTPQEFPDYFAEAGEFDTYVQDWLAYREVYNSHASPVSANAS